MKKTILFAVSISAVLLAGCLPQEKLTGRVIDTAGPVAGAAVLGMVWVEDAAKIKPAPEAKDLSLEERDTALNTDMKTRGLPVAYARGISGDDGWFRLEKLHFSAETARAIKAMQTPRITRVTVWAFQRGYRKQAVTTFLKDNAEEIPAATLLLFKPADWKELYRDNTVDSLTRDYMVKGYSKAFGATEAEKDWILEYTHSNLWQAYVESDIKGDKAMEEMCGRDYSDLQVSPEGIQRNPARERCAELKQRMNAVREIEELWIAHAKRSEDPLAAAKEVVRRAIALLPAEASEPVQYESMILAGIEDAANAKNRGAINNNPGTHWEEEAGLQYGRGNKAAAYRVLGSNIYRQLPEEIKQGALTAQASIRAIPGIRETAAGFYLLMTRPLTAQLPGGDNGNNGGKSKSSTDTAKEEGVLIEEYVAKVIIEGKWGTGPGEFGVAWTYAGDTDSPMSPSGSKSMPIYPSSLAVDGKGDIYVLDVINNRVQKFDAEGKFIKAIDVEAYSGEEQPIWYGKVTTEDGGEILDRVDSKDKSGKIVGVDCWFPYYWPLTVEGINIVIDSKDTLYYYLKRVKDGRETGEVWEFRKDKLVKKYSSAEKGGLPSRFQLSPVGSNQFVLTVVDSPVEPKVQTYRVDIKKDGENSRIYIKNAAKNKEFDIKIPPSSAYFAAKARHGRAKSDVYFEKMLDTGNFQVRTVNGDLENIETEEREYTPEGKLVRRVKSPPGYSHGIDVGEDGIKVIRWVIEKGK
jgi:hypothetical protein